MHVAQEDLDRLAECLAAERGIYQETAITRIDFLCSQLQAEAAILSGRGRKLEKLRVLAAAYAGGFLVQQVWLDAGLPNYVLSRQTGGDQPFGRPLCPNCVDCLHDR